MFFKCFLQHFELGVAVATADLAHRVEAEYGQNTSLGLRDIHIRGLHDAH